MAEETLSVKDRAQKTLLSVGRFLISRRVIPTLKGTIAYIIAFILILSRSFDDLSTYPLAFSSMMIVVIAGKPGESVGACIQGIALSLVGALSGCVGFVILANLVRWPVAQGVAFAVIVYVMALVKSKGPRYLPFALLCVLNSFNGIYTSYLLGSVFSPKVLVAYLTSYLWGGAIVLAVNLLVFPMSSEKALRDTLSTSLAHIGTFAHLLAKGYTLELTDEERAIRDHLARTIRADFGYLTRKIEETTIEINYSKFSLKDYQTFVSSTRSLQQALITAHSSLVGVEKQDRQMFKERFLPGTLSAFNKLRRAVDLTIRDLGNELGCQPIVIPATQAKYKEFMDLERTGNGTSEEESTRSSNPAENDQFSGEVAERLQELSGRLAAEADNSTVPPTRSGTPDLTRPNSQYTSNLDTPSSQTRTPKEAATPRNKLFECGMDRLRREFNLYSVKQHDSLQSALINGQLFDAADAELRVDEPIKMRDIYGVDGIEIPAEEYIDTEGRSLRNRKNGAEKIPDSFRLSDPEEERDASKFLMEGNSLIRVWGFLFAMEQFVDHLETLWTHVRPTGIKREKRLHIHFFEALQRPHLKSRAEDESVDIPLQEALAILEQRPYTPVVLNIWQRLDQVHRLIQSPTSIYAAKTAAAASVFGTLIYASVPRPWFISYSLSSGVLTIVVALAPTLGQSLNSFVFQIAGSAIGYLWGLALLSMFRNVGGRTINPYGVVCMVLPYAFIMQYVLYERPALFVLALLALNGTGVLVATEWIAVEFLHRENFDSPALRTGGKAISALMVAVAIVAIFQLFILRNPARRTLRKAVAALTYQTLSYMVLLHAYSRVMMIASNPDDRPPKAALIRIENELKHRELKLQSAIINLTPLVGFASAEPHFTKPFRKDVVLKIIRGNQLILDRLREARAALDTQPFEEFILVHFSSILAPYRARNVRIMRTQLYLIASSIQAKAPLPQFTPGNILTNRARANMIHDYLVLSARFSKTEQGRVSIRSREFMRFMSHVLCSTAIIQPLLDMEEASKELFGKLEETLL
ncbi:hypothetical protein M422DRAFT_28858 [Sphaerobolus stellatus SS14]|nr:hypothetical protein M422DRAFT_28858 [Sphaerobolus stellatus SS14]